jgi:NADP-dependent 3-hydroxy acid dehydrogenase YdfG
MAENIDGKVVVITGASSGIGEATARLLASKGAPVALGARRRERLDSLVNEIEKSGGKAVAYRTDVTRREEVEALVEGAVATFGRVDVMVNNAGIMPLSPLDRLDVDDWDRMIDVNIKGVLYGVAAVLPLMERQKSGHVINISSVAGHKVRADSTVYSATKHAVRVISEGLRQAVKPYNIRSTIISPGAVATELPNSITDPAIKQRVSETYKIAISPEAVARAIAYAIGEPPDVDINEILVRPTAQEW